MMKMNNDDEHNGILQNIEHVKSAKPTLSLIAWSITILGAILFLGGIFLSINGMLASTKFKLWGNEFESTSIGVTFIFLGVILIVLTYRKIISSIENLAKIPDNNTRRRKSPKISSK